MIFNQKCIKIETEVFMKYRVRHQIFHEYSNDVRDIDDWHIKI